MGGSPAGSRPRIAAVVPARNEGARIGATLAALARLPLAEVVVVDDGSHDGTGQVARNARARVIRLDEHRGKGQAMEAGWRATQAEIILFADADLGFTAERLWPLVEAVLGGQADLAVAAFRAGGGGVGLATGTARWGIRRLAGFEATAPLSGQRAVRREVLEAVSPLEDGFGVEVAMTIDALRAGYRVVEIPIPLSHRVTGKDLAGFLHRGRQLAAILKALARRWRAPARRTPG